MQRADQMIEKPRRIGIGALGEDRHRLAITLTFD